LKIREDSAVGQFEGYRPWLLLKNLSLHSSNRQMALATPLFFYIWPQAADSTIFDRARSR
jgi:hypothetical protein